MLKLTPAQMVSLPWRWQGPAQERDEHANEWWEIRIDEIPDFFVAAATPEQAIAEAPAALEAYLASYLGHEGRPPLPAVFGEEREVPEAYARVRELQVVP